MRNWLFIWLISVSANRIIAFYYAIFHSDYIDLNRIMYGLSKKKMPYLYPIDEAIGLLNNEIRLVEWRIKYPEQFKCMHSACAFLNTEGGWLIFGIAPKSLKIIGQEVTDKTQQEIAQALAGLEPAVDVRVAYIDVPEHPGNKVIAMHFDGWVWGEHPHTFHGCPYFKVESTTKVMPQDMYDERIRAHQPQLYAWERLAADGVALADLDENLIRNSIRRGIDGGRIPESALYESTGDILSKWKLLKNGVPTNGAVLLFSNNIDEYPQFTLRMARFVGTNKNMFRDINVLKVISSNC